MAYSRTQRFRKSILEHGGRIYRNEGVFGFFKGIPFVWMGVIPY